MSNVTTLGPLFDTVDSNETLDLSDKIINFVVQTRPTVSTITSITKAISRATPSLGALVANSDQSGGANPAIYTPICVVVLLVAVGSAFYGKNKTNDNNDRRDSRNDELRNSRGLKVIPKSSKADFDESTAVYEDMNSRSNMSLAQSMSFGGSKHKLNPHIDSISLHQSVSQMSLTAPRHNGGGKMAPARIEEENKEDELKSKSSLQVVNEIKPKKNLSGEKTNINKALSNEENRDLLQKIKSSSHIIQKANAAKNKQNEEESPMTESQIKISVSPPQKADKTK